MKKIRKFVLLLSCIGLMTGFSACESSRIVHCDHCGKELKVKVSSNMTDDWIIYCKDCEKELGLDQMVQPSGK